MAEVPNGRYCRGGLLLQLLVREAVRGCADGIGQYAVFISLHCQCLAQRDQRALGRAVADLPSAPMKARVAGDQHNAAEAAHEHLRPRGLQELHVPDEVHVHRAGELLERGIRKARILALVCVRDHYVHPIPVIHGCIDERLPSFRHIAILCNSLTVLRLDLGYDFVSLHRVGVVHQDLCSTCSKEKATQAAEASATSSHDGNPIVEAQLVLALALLQLGAGEAGLGGRLATGLVAHVQIQAWVARVFPLCPFRPLRGNGLQRVRVRGLEGHKGVVGLPAKRLDVTLLCTEDARRGLASLVAKVCHSLVRGLECRRELGLGRAKRNRPQVVGHARKADGADDVGKDAVLEALNCKRLPHRRQGQLRSAVVALPPVTVQPRLTRNDHDTTVLLLNKVRPGSLQHFVVPKNMGVDDVGEVLGLHDLESVIIEKPSVGHDDVDPAKLIQHKGHDVVGSRRNVAVLCNRSAATCSDLGDDLVRFLRRAVVHHDFGAPRRKQHRVRTTQATTSTCDESHLTVKAQFAQAKPLQLNSALCEVRVSLVAGHGSLHVVLAHKVFSEAELLQERLLQL
mmetsp:Transcript_113063/g.314681  ORF Transcript_113063/g.314681 Transcript_113063/m.314681 type:complete len:569 (+) Transcript_113063:326-2032(+)